LVGESLGKLPVERLAERLAERSEVTMAARSEALLEETDPVQWLAL